VAARSLGIPAPTLFGKPVYLDPTLPAATTAGAYSVWLGDWARAYVVVRYGRPILIRDDVTMRARSWPTARPALAGT
jgi:HK97 family phage major capsid protein